jgi:hypothetical protein
MEGTNPCWLTGPSYCRQAANAWTVALGGSSAITVAAPNAALCANTTNTHGAFNIAVATTSAQDAYIAYTFGSAQTDLNIQFYLTVTSSSLGDGIYGQIFAHDSAGPTLFNTLYLVNVGGTPKLSLWYQVTNPEDTQLGTAQTITLGTPYRININWNEAGTISWSIDGNPIATAYDGSTSFLVTDLVFGAQAMDYAGRPGITYTYQIDNIAIDPTGTPGACQ